MEKFEKLIGTVIDGKYRIEEIVGRGGMSVVMRAVCVADGKTVTVKILNEDTEEENVYSRFVNEAEAISRLNHKNVVHVLDVETRKESEYKYIVMDYIDGITLKEYLEKKGRLGWKEAAHYIVQVLDALSHAHEHKVLHRDIKPENIMLLRDGTIKVIDFGIAKLPESTSLTMTNKAIGTVYYISPEQANGEANEQSDIYSTGITLYELVTGKLPFFAKASITVAMMHISSEPTPPTEICSDIPKGLEQIIIKAMMKDPSLRFGKASAMKRALSYLIEHPETVFKEDTVIGSDGKPIRGTGAVKQDAENTPKDTEEDEEDEDTRTSMLPIILGVTLAFFTVAIVCLIIAINKLGIDKMILPETNIDTSDNTLIIPNLVGDIYADWLVEDLQTDGYKVTVQYDYYENAEKNEIMNQEPSASSERRYMENGVPLKIYVNTGSSDIILDDYSITDERQARFKLEEVGLKSVTVEEYNDTVIAGYVIRTEPISGTTLQPGDTVTLYVSKGQEKNTVKMPDILGMTVSQGERELIKKGISVGTKTYAPSNQYPDGVIIGVSINAGTPVTPKFTSVDLVISKTEIASEPTETAAQAPVASEAAAQAQHPAIEQ